MKIHVGMAALQESSPGARDKAGLLCVPTIYRPTVLLSSASAIIMLQLLSTEVLRMTPRQADRSSLVVSSPVSGDRTVVPLGS